MLGKVDFAHALPASALDWNGTRAKSIGGHVRARNHRCACVCGGPKAERGWGEGATLFCAAVKAECGCKSTDRLRVRAGAQHSRLN
eukprot:4296308-Alexandrium_andersonii.AAC.1